MTPTSDSDTGESRVESLLEISDRLAAACDDLHLSHPVAVTYNPLVYARDPFSLYCEMYGGPPRECLILGMNPGPWGMVQTGIPFGSVDIVRDWLIIDGQVVQPLTVHPKRPVIGFGCTRQEVSGVRLWSWARERFGEPHAFFTRFLVLNYCPLAFFDREGKNITPDKLDVRSREQLFAICDHALRSIVRLMGPRCVVGVGKFAETRATAVCGPLGIRVVGIPHPSPANPKANQGWASQVDHIMTESGLLQPGTAFRRQA